MGIDGDVLRTNARRNQPVGVRAGGSALPGVGGAPEEKAWWCRAARAERTWNAKAGGAQECRITRRSSSRRLVAGRWSRRSRRSAGQSVRSGLRSGQCDPNRNGTSGRGSGTGRATARAAEIPLSGARRPTRRIPIGRRGVAGWGSVGSGGGGRGRRVRCACAPGDGGAVNVAWVHHETVMFSSRSSRSVGLRPAPV
jgi:hypothetical protein